MGGELDAASGPSYGVEEEFLLVDKAGRPLALSPEVVRRAAEQGVELQLETTFAQVEVATDKAASSTALGEQIRSLRQAAASSARQAGAVLVAAALPPGGSGPGPLRGTDRYRWMSDRLGMVTDERENCGCHVHVEVPSRDAAIEVSNWLRPWLPLMLALTANSAIYRGVNTRHASWRNVMWSRWPSAGPPPYFEAAADYDRAVTMLLESGAMLDHGMVYWHVRASTRFPTVEVRVADVPATAAETVLYATLVRAAVVAALARYERGERAPRVPDHMLRLACWSAAREGLGGHLIDIANCGKIVTTVHLLGVWLATLRPALEELGEYGWVCNELRTLMREGNGAMRQLHAWQSGENTADVVAALAAATLA